MSEENKAQDQKGAGDQSNLWFDIDLTKCTKEEFWKVVGPEEGNPRAREDYLLHPEKFTEFNKRLEEMVRAEQQPTSGSEPAAPAQPDSSARQAPEGAAQPQLGAAPAAPAATPPAEEEIELTGIKVPKNLFGTYLTGRTPAEAIVEALKGNREKDRTIGEFQSRNSALSSQTLTLQQQLLEATIGKKTAEAQPRAAAPVFPQFNIEEIDFSALENADLMDPDSHGIVKDGIKKVKGIIASVKQQAEAAKAQPSPEPVKFDADKDPEVTNLKQGIADGQLQRDLFEIDLAASQVPQLRMSKPFAQVDLEVSAFYDKVKAASGMQGNRMDAVAHYFGSSPESKAFHDLCASKGIVPPEDYNKHQVAYRAYQRYSGSGRTVPIKDCIDLEVMRSPLPAPQPSPVPPPQTHQQTHQQRIDEHVQQRQQQQVPPGVIPDIPPTVGSPSVFLPNETEQSQIAFKLQNDPNSLTAAEAAFVVEAFRREGYLDDQIPLNIRNKVKG